ncbi:MAG: type II secretion system F family protein [Candidatus Nanopelagicales bacterium]
MILSMPGAVAGLAFGVACALLVSWARARRPLSVSDRIGPYVGIPGHTDVVSAHRSLRSFAFASRRHSDASTAEARRAGGRGVRPSSREERLTWAVLGALVGAAAAGVMTVGDPSPAAVVGLGAVGAVAGLGLVDLRRRSAERRRVKQVDERVPVLADLLALAVSAGAGPIIALNRAAAVVDGPLAEDVSGAIARITSGEAMESVLRELGGSSPALRRLMDAVLISLERGSPLADVLRAQAHDARADERRRLMEAAGRKDVAMVMPIVFLVLPAVVLIALFPGLASMRLVVP